MSSAEITAFLEAAPTQHSQRCATNQSPIDAGSWPAAARDLRHAAALAQDLATQAHQLADWCDVQAANGQGGSAAPPAVATPADSLTLEALKAGLMALANGLGIDHSARVLEAISSTFAATHASRRLPAEAAVIGEALDHDSLEQGEPA